MDNKLRDLYEPKKSHKSYPQAYKEEVVLMLLEQGYSVSDAVKSLGVSTSLLYNWKESTNTTIVQEIQRANESLGSNDAIKKLDKYELLILYDIGYFKERDSESQVQFELIAHRYEHGSLFLTSNQVFSKWDSIFGYNMMTVAAIDRLISPQ